MPRIGLIVTSGAGGAGCVSGVGGKGVGITVSTSGGGCSSVGMSTSWHVSDVLAFAFGTGRAGLLELRRFSAGRSQSIKRRTSMIRGRGIGSGIGNGAGGTGG